MGMDFLPYKQSLREWLGDRLNERSAQELVERIDSLDLGPPLVELLGELGVLSKKVRGEAVWALGELHRQGQLSSAVSWLDLGISFTQSSGALGLRYFKESPFIIGLLKNDSSRETLLSQVMELADGDSEGAPQCAYEWFKVLPGLSCEVSLEDLPEWASLGLNLADWNYVLGNEFFRECPSISKAIPLSAAKPWIEFGMKLMVTNSLGKPDYVGTLEFFRASPNLFLDVEGTEVKLGMIALGSALANQAPDHAITFLADAPHILRELPTKDWQVRVLKFGLLVADHDAETTLAYFRRSPDVLALMGSDGNSEIFEAWFAQGMEALEYSVEGGRAFFGLESKQACSAVEESMQGVPLRQVARSLKMFARALCGQEVVLESFPENRGESSSLPDVPKQSELSVGGKWSEKEPTIWLPVVMKRSESREGNRRWYTVMVAHEVGHLEFGTYRLSPDRFQTLAALVTQRYGFPPLSSQQEILNLGHLFRAYPQPQIIQDLWEIIEDARIDYLLKYEYPGLKKDLSVLTHEVLKTRTLSHGMTAREIVLDALLLHFSGATKDTFTSPGIQEVVDEAWGKAQEILQPHATVDDALTLADELYQILEVRIGTYEQDREELEPFPNASGVSQEGETHEAAEHLEGDYQPIQNLGYRGRLDPFQVMSEKTASPFTETGKQSQEFGGRPGGSGGTSTPPNRREQALQDPSQDSKAPVFGESPLDQWFQPHSNLGAQGKGEALGNQGYVYEEWDGGIRDYRPRWCRVIERSGRDGSPEFVEDTFKSYGPIVRLIRKYFEVLRPEAFRRLGRQTDGEEIDFDALLNWKIDRRIGRETADQIYCTRQKRDRQVAVAFLMDMSGSTGRQIGAHGRPVIEIEKEGLLLLSEAVSAIGDQFAIYGFSGQSRQAVDLYVLKEFDQQPGGRVGVKISGVKPQQQNRDGAAIRHVTHRLMQQAAKVRLLILLSDGKPLDDDYTDEYALEDTKVALRESRLQGVHPFCITIDQAATDYVKRMFGDIGYVVIDEVEALPTRLPKIYQRLTAR